MKSRMLLMSAGACLVGTLCGCYQSPQQRLHGRWYNSEMSLRFQPDGRVVYNSQTGLSRGRYFFALDWQPTAGDQATRPLILDIVRNGRRQQLAFEATFLANDRLRLQESPRPATGVRPTESIREFVVLRKAEDSPPVRAAIAHRQ